MDIEVRSPHNDEVDLTATIAGAVATTVPPARTIPATQAPATATPADAVSGSPTFTG